MHMKLKKLFVLAILFGFCGNLMAQPFPPPPEDPFSLFGLPIDSNAMYLGIALLVYGTYTILKKYNTNVIASLKKVFIK